MSFGFSVMIHLTSDVEPVGFNLIDQRGAGNAELLGRPRAVAAVEPKRLLDVHPLHLGERLGLVAPSPPTPPTPPTPLTPISATPAPAHVRRQVLDGFPYLTHLPGPRRRQELLQRFPQQHVLTHQPDLVAYARRDDGQVIQVQGLRDDVLGAKLHGARPRRNVSLIGEENDGALPGP